MCRTGFSYLCDTFALVHERIYMRRTTYAAVGGAFSKCAADSASGGRQLIERVCALSRGPDVHLDEWTGQFTPVSTGQRLLYTPSSPTAATTSIWLM